MLDGTKKPGDAFGKVSEPPEPRGIMEDVAGYQAAKTERPIEPSETLSGKRKDTGETEIRKGGVEREKPDEKTGIPGKVTSTGRKAKIKDMAGEREERW